MADWPTIPDASGNALDGTAVKMSVVAISNNSIDGVFSKKSMVFDGVDQLINFGDVLGKDRLDAYSIEFWVKGETGARANQPYIVCKLEPAPTYRGFSVYINTTGGLVIQVLHDNATSDTMVVNTTTVPWLNGTWQHAVITVDGSGTAAGVKMYYNGSLVTDFDANDNLTGTTLNSVSLTVAGSEQLAGRHLAGELDEIGIYGDVLTAGEVTWLYNAGSPPDKLDGAAPTSLEAWWRMGEGITYPATMPDWPGIPDASGNGLYGVEAYMEEADLALDSPGGTFSRKSFVFDGVDERVVMSDVLGWDGYSPQSWEFWYKTTTATVSAMMGKMGNPGSGFQFIANNNGKFVVDVREVFITKDIVLETPLAYNTGAWVHVVVTTTGAAGAASDFQIYMNGSPIAFNTVRDNLTNPLANTDDFCLGALWDGAIPFNGSMTEPAVYSDVLTPTEVTWLYNSGSPRDLLDGAAPDNLEAWWRADGVNWPVQGLVAANFTPSAQEEDSHAQVVVGGGGGPGIVDYFKMRCRDSGLAPPGYVVWTVTGAPDDDASEAPLVGVASDIMVMTSWQT